MGVLPVTVLLFAQGSVMFYYIRIFQSNVNSFEPIMPSTVVFEAYWRCLPHGAIRNNSTGWWSGSSGGAPV
jgi:hypothetical protein